MKLLEDRIVKDGIVSAGNVLKVDCFLNHQIDVAFINELGKEFYRLFKDAGVNKILTIEASGIGIACLAAQHFNVPVVFAKKSKSKNIAGDVYVSKVTSFTHGTTHDVIVSKKFLNENDRVLILDDFLARGQALLGLIDLVEAAGAKVVGAGIVTMVELGEKSDVTISCIPLSPLRDLLELRGNYQQLTQRDYYATLDQNAYVHVILTDEDDIPDAAAKLRVIYPNLMKLTYDNQRTRSHADFSQTTQVEQRTPLSLFSDFYQQQNGQPLSKEQEAYMAQLIGRIWEVTP
mgnify:CR=1 FL=1